MPGETFIPKPDIDRKPDLQEIKMLRARGQEIIFSYFQKGKTPTALMIGVHNALQQIDREYFNLPYLTGEMLPALLHSQDLIKENVLLQQYMAQKSIDLNTLLRVSVAGDYMLDLETSLLGRLRDTEEATVNHVTADGNSLVVDKEEAESLQKGPISLVGNASTVPVYADIESAQNALLVTNTAAQAGIYPSADLQACIFTANLNALGLYSACSNNVYINKRPFGIALATYLHELRHTEQPVLLSLIKEIDAYMYAANNIALIEELTVTNSDSPFMNYQDFKIKLERARAIQNRKIMSMLDKIADPSIEVQISANHNISFMINRVNQNCSVSSIDGS